MSKSIQIIYNSPIKKSQKQKQISFSPCPPMELVLVINDRYSMIRIIGTTTNGTMVRNSYFRRKMPWDFFIENIKNFPQLLLSK